MNIVNFAHQIIELAEERDYWMRQAKFYKEMHEEHMQDTTDSIRRHEETFGKILTACLDENSGINRSTRALLRDPLNGYAEE